jgi:hypothetical protein
LTRIRKRIRRPIPNPQIGLDLVETEGVEVPDETGGMMIDTGDVLIVVARGGTHAEIDVIEDTRIYPFNVTYISKEMRIQAHELYYIFLHQARLRTVHGYIYCR